MQFGIPRLVVGMVLLTAAESSAQARPASQVTGLRIVPVSNAAVTAPIRNAYGRVRSIAGPVLTLDIDGRDMTFMVDDSTGVLARGASRATRRAGGGLPIADLVHTGDIVRVSYRELNGWMRISEIQVRSRGTIAAR